MRRPIIDWDYNDFITTIDGQDFRFIVERTFGGFEAQAYLPMYNKSDLFCNQCFSRKSSEDAILKLVKLLEQ